MKVGFSVCDITPELGIYLTGYGMPERLADSVHSPLQVTAMVLQEGEKTAVVLGVDWCFVGGELTQLIRKAISEKTQIPEQHILISCSHTHSAPHTTSARTLGRTAVDPEGKGVQYAKDCIPTFVECVCQAQERLRECKAGFGHTHTEAGVSRRGMNEKGEVVGFLADPYLIYDSNMTTVYFKDAETDEDLGIFVHASGHNTSMGNVSRAISSDWCGVMRRRIHDHYSVPIIFINGAIGDVGPRTNYWVKWRNGFSAGVGDGVKSAEEVGYRAASDALQSLEGIRDFRTELPLKIHVGELRLPQALSMGRDEAKAVLDSFDATAGEASEPDINYQIAKSVYSAWQEPPQPELVAEQTLVAFGPVALVPFPFEVFSIFSLRLRKYGPFEYTLLASNTNDRYAYMPDRGAFAMGGYEPSCLRMIRPYVIKPEAGDIAIVQCLEALRSM